MSVRTMYVDYISEEEGEEYHILTFKCLAETYIDAILQCKNAHHNCAIIDCKYDIES